MALPHIVEEFPIETIKDACPSGYNALLGAGIIPYTSDLQARLKVLSNDSEQLTFHRQCRVTASDIALLNNLKGLPNAPVNYKEEDILDFKYGKDLPTDAMRKGLELEDSIAADYRRKWGPRRYTSEKGHIVMHPDIPWLSATPDFFIRVKTQPTESFYNHLLEIKTTCSDMPDEVPPNVLAQLLTQMIVVRDAMPSFFQNGKVVIVVRYVNVNSEEPPADFQVELTLQMEIMWRRWLQKAWVSYFTTILPRFVSEHPGLEAKGRGLDAGIRHDRGTSSDRALGKTPLKISKPAVALLNNNDAPHTGQFVNYVGNPMKVPVKVIKRTPGKSRIEVAVGDGSSLIAASRADVIDAPDSTVKPTNEHVGCNVLIIGGNFKGMRGTLLKWSQTYSSVDFGGGKPNRLGSKYVHVTNPRLGASGNVIIVETKKRYIVPKDDALQFLAVYKRKNKMDTVLKRPENRITFNGYFQNAAAPGGTSQSGQDTICSDDEEEDSDDDYSDDEFDY